MEVSCKGFVASHNKAKGEFSVRVLGGAFHLNGRIESVRSVVRGVSLNVYDSVIFNASQSSGTWYAYDVSPEIKVPNRRK